MFKKSGPPAAKGVLADRVRQLAERKPQLDPEAPRYRQSEGRAPRQPLFRQGVLTFDPGQRLNVAIKNLSETGARIEFFTRMVLPDEVMVIEPTLKLRRRARVVWQGDGIAGVQFIDG